MKNFNSVFCEKCTKTRFLHRGISTNAILTRHKNSIIINESIDEERYLEFLAESRRLVRDGRIHRIKSPRSPSPKVFFEVSRPTRSFCVKGERIIQYEKPKSGIARPYLYFVGSSLWETGFFVFLREEKQIKCLLYKRKRKG